MMHQALYRKWRPQTFDDVCGQEHITSVLRHETATGAFSHAYLFCGSRGTGKTTRAKILSKAVNCEHPVNGSPCGECAACRSIDSGATTDVLEMDAASNNGVDNIRDIRDEVVYSPSELRYRVYIIDEVHMLSASAFNALLKTLEEPPEHVIFILATTELQKLPATIISRCQRFDFRRISMDALVGRLETVAQGEGIELDPDAARMLARLSQGGMRDAISLLELCAGTGGKVDPASVIEAVGLTGQDSVFRVITAVTEHDYETLFAQVAEVVRSSKDIMVFWQDLISTWRDMLVIKTAANAMSYLDLSDHEAEQLSALAAKIPRETLLYQCKLLEDALFSMQKSNAVRRVLAETTLLRMSDEALELSLEALQSRIAHIEEQMLSGVRVESLSSVPTPSESAPQPAPNPSPAPKATAPAPVAQPSQASAPATRQLRAIRNWMEVAERIGRSEPMLVGFVRAARAYTTEDGKVILRFENAFAQKMLEADGARSRLAAAIAAVLRTDVRERDLIYEVAQKGEAFSAIDELLGEADDN